MQDPSVLSSECYLQFVQLFVEVQCRGMHVISTFTFVGSAFLKEKWNTISWKWAFQLFGKLITKRLLSLSKHANCLTRQFVRSPIPIHSNLYNVQTSHAFILMHVYSFTHNICMGIQNRSLYLAQARAFPSWPRFRGPGCKFFSYYFQCTLRSLVQVWLKLSLQLNWS